MSDNLGGSDAGAGGILHRAAQRSPRVLGLECCGKHDGEQKRGALDKSCFHVSEQEDRLDCVARYYQRS
jgi:hypothetical protein